MRKTKILTMELQKESLNVLYALVLVEETIHSLRRIRENECEIDAQIEASIQFSSRYGTEAEEEFNRYHRPRKIPRRQDENPISASLIPFRAFYRKAVIEVLDSLITEYNENLKQCLEKIKPLADFVRPPLQSLDVQKMNEISSLFPPSIKVNAECLHAEFEIFRTVVEKSNDPCKTAEDFCQQAHFNKSIFPNVYKTSLLLL